MSSIDVLKAKQFFDDKGIELIVDVELFKNLGVFVKNKSCSAYSIETIGKGIIGSLFNCEDCIFNKFERRNLGNSTAVCYLTLIRIDHLNKGLASDFDQFDKIVANIVEEFYNHYKIFFEEVRYE